MSAARALLSCMFICVVLLILNVTCSVRWVASRHCLQVDKLVQTRWPTPEEEAAMPGLTALINEFGVHKHTARCGGSDEKCCWGFPKKVCEQTYQDARGRWHTKRGPDEVWLNPTSHLITYLLKCHYYWEVCCGRAGIGYLLDYPFKGDTSVVAKLNEAHAAQAAGGHKHFDEVRFLQHYRSVAATEGTVRLLGLEMVRQYPATSEVRVRTALTHQLNNCVAALTSSLRVRC